jgi:hypothetical protein
VAGPGGRKRGGNLQTVSYLQPTLLHPSGFIHVWDYLFIRTHSYKMKYQNLQLTERYE